MKTGIYGVFINQELVFEGGYEEANSYVMQEIERISSAYASSDVEILVPEEKEESYEHQVLIAVSDDRPFYYEILVIEKIENMED